MLVRAHGPTRQRRRQGGGLLVESALVVLVMVAILGAFLHEYAQQLDVQAAIGDVRWALEVAQAARSWVQQNDIASSVALGQHSTTLITPAVLVSNGALPANFALVPPSGSAQVSVYAQGTAAHPLYGILVVTGRMLRAAAGAQIQAQQPRHASAFVVLVSAGEGTFSARAGVSGALPNYGVALTDPSSVMRVGAFAWAD